MSLAEIAKSSTFFKVQSVAHNQKWIIMIIQAIECMIARKTFSISYSIFGYYITLANAENKAHLLAPQNMESSFALLDVI